MHQEMRDDDSIDMDPFETAFAAASAAAPHLQWAIEWPDGRVMVVDGEDEALLIARSAPSCHMVRRYITPWERKDV